MAKAVILWHGAPVESKRDSLSDHPARGRSKRRVRFFSGGIIVPSTQAKKRVRERSTLARQLEILRSAASQQRGEAGEPNQGLPRVPG